MKPEPTASSVNWYRTPLDPARHKALHERSDILGLLQSLGYLGVLLMTGSLALYAARHWSVPVLISCIFLHGTCFAFQINAVHELGHGTVFRSKFLNQFFLRIFAFLGWIHCDVFEKSHARHHRYTLHPPEDLEVVLPIRIMVKQFFQQGFLNPAGFWYSLKEAVRIAHGKFSGSWELKLFPVDNPGLRRTPVRWARLLLAGQGLILLVSIFCQCWLIPVLVTFAPFYGGWLFFLCNNTQHIGLQDNVPDFRLCCRTFTLNPVAQFLYWHMNYHTEHHMYAAVPCYRLGKLHALIRHDLPQCPNGLLATWCEIIDIQKKQAIDPNYQYKAPLPAAQNS